MKWLVKAMVQKVLSGLPGGDGLNYLMQRRITGGLPRSPQELLEKFDAALSHYQAALEYGGSAPARSFEIGPGWELAVPLCLYMLGVERQVLADLRPLLKPELLAHAAGFYLAEHDALERRAGRELRRLPGEALTPAGLEALGISYRAPLDASQSGLAPGSIDLVHSTQVLEHVPPEALIPLMTECARVVSPDGVVSHTIDLADHYMHFDSACPPYNFLCYGQRVWNLLNSGLHYQNRLRLSDYLSAMQKAGLELVSQDLCQPTTAQLTCLQQMPLDQRFKSYAPDDLAVLGAHLVAKA